MKLLFAPAMFLLVLCANCTSDSTNASTAGTKTVNPETHSATANEHYKDGWDNLKEGSREVAAGVSTTTKEATKDAETSVMAVACPIAADTHAHVYYAKDSPGYEKMLGSEKQKVRECFSSEASAREKGYTRVR